MAGPTSVLARIPVIVTEKISGSGGGLAWVTPSPIGCCQGIPHRDGPG